MAKKEEKTNVMRTLDQKKIAYIPHAYDPDGPIDGVSVASGLVGPGLRVQDPGDPGVAAAITFSTSRQQRAWT